MVSLGSSLRGLFGLPLLPLSLCAPFGCVDELSHVLWSSNVSDTFTVTFLGSQEQGRNHLGQSPSITQRAGRVQAQGTGRCRL